MKLGLIARADNTGLGMQTWEFYKHMKPDKTMVVDISALNGNRQYPERYPDAMSIFGFPNDGDIRVFLQGLDCVFLAEAPYNFNLYSIAKEMGVKVADQYNYEFFDWIANPDLPKPDMLIAPSKWQYDFIQKFCEENHIVHEYLHCPVNREALPRKEIKKYRTFLHVAGRSAAHDRNGTMTVILAARYLKTDAKILVHFQGEQGLPHQATYSIHDYRTQHALNGGNVEIIENEFENYSDVYAQGDAMVLPRRYGGNCLPLNEALSSGMPVIMTDISPNNELLPKRWLIPATHMDTFTPRMEVDIYGSDPKALAEKIDWLYNLGEMEAAFESSIANAIAEEIDWKVMAPKYRASLEALCRLQ